MNLYDVLKLLVDRSDIQEAIRADCHKVIQEAETTGVLGTLADKQIRAHQHNYNAPITETIYNGGGIAIEYQTYIACCHCREEKPGSRTTKPVPFTNHGLRLNRETQ